MPIPPQPIGFRVPTPATRLHTPTPSQVRQSRYVNVTALLATGQFHIDELGYLISANGSRFRLPSGPPEGRTIMRLQPVPPNLPLPGSSNSALQLADSASAAVVPDQLNGTTHTIRGQTSFAGWNTPTPTSDDLFLPPPSHGASVGQNIDWAALLFTLIVGSIALATNFALVVISSWYLCRPRHRSGRPTNHHHHHQQQQQQGHQHQLNIGLTDATMFVEGTLASSRGGGGSSFVSLQRIPTKLSMESAGGHRATTVTNQRPLRPRCLKRPGYRSAPVSGDEAGVASRRFRAARARLQQGSKQQPVFRHRTKRRQEQRRRGAPRTDEQEDTTSSVDSSQVPDSDEDESLDVSDRDHALSDAHYDTEVPSSSTQDQNIYGDGDADDDADSLSADDSSSAVTGVPRRRAGRWLNECRTTQQPAQRNQVGHRLTTTSSKRNSAAYMTADGGRLEDLEEEEGGDLGGVGGGEPSIHHRVAAGGSNGLQSSLSVCVHIALLGCVLSAVHLAIVCTGLTSVLPTVRSDDDSSATSGTFLSPLWQLTCLLVSSVAMDTLMCVRLHLISCFLYHVFLNSLLFFSSSSAAAASPFTTNFGTLISLAAGAPGASVGCLKAAGQPPGSPRSRQQRFACLALSHSLPWALAAGSALFIALRPSASAGEDPPPPLQTSIEGFKGLRFCCCNLNIFFTGLRSILPCDPTAAASSEGGSGGDLFITTVLLLFVPLVGQLLCCLPFACCLKTPPARRLKSTAGSSGIPTIQRLRILTSLLFILSTTSCLTVGIYVVLFNNGRNPSAWAREVPSVIARLTILHLALDPCILCLIFRQLLTQPPPQTVVWASASSLPVLTADSGGIQSAPQHLLQPTAVPAAQMVCLAPPEDQQSCYQNSSSSPCLQLVHQVDCPYLSRQTKRDPESSSLSDYYHKAGLLIRPTAERRPSFRNNVPGTPGTAAAAAAAAAAMAAAAAVSGGVTADSMEMHQCAHHSQNASNVALRVSPPSPDPSTTATTTFPKLCQHHQHLLRQHLVQQQQQQQQRTTTSSTTSGSSLQRARKDVEVDLPRNGLEVVVPCSTGVPIGVASFPGRPPQNSAATAAVMAAAAAAVAANSRAAAAAVAAAAGGTNQFSSPTDSTSTPPSTLFAFPTQLQPPSSPSSPPAPAHDAFTAAPVYLGDPDDKDTTAAAAASALVHSFIKRTPTKATASDQLSPPRQT